MNVCPDCGMGPRGIESEDGRHECQNCGLERFECVGMYCTELLPAPGTCSKSCDETVQNR